MYEKFLTLPKDKQRRIVDAALEVFAQNDYKHASTDVIAAKAKIAKGLLFYYFKNKMALYLYLYDYALQLVRSGVQAAHLDGVTDFFEMMAAGAKLKLDLARQSPYLLDFCVRAFYSQHEAVSKAVQTRLDSDLKNTFAAYFQGIDFTRFRPGVDPAYLLQTLTWMTEGYLLEKQRAGLPIEPDAIMQDFARWADMFRQIAYREEYL